MAKYNHSKKTNKKKFLIPLLVAVSLVALFLISFGITSLVLDANQRPDVDEEIEETSTPIPPDEFDDDYSFDDEEMEDWYADGSSDIREESTPTKRPSSSKNNAAPTSKPTQAQATHAPTQAPAQPTKAPAAVPTQAPALAPTQAPAPAPAPEVEVAPAPEADPAPAPEADPAPEAATE